MRLDALERRLRFAPPQPAGCGIVLTERDHLIFETLNRHGPLPSTYLFELTRHLPKSRHPKGFLRRLTKLYNGYCADWRSHPDHICQPVAYLARPDWQGDEKDRPVIYALNPLSEAVLLSRGIPVIRRNDHFIHRFMTACVGASLKLYLESRRCEYHDRFKILAHPRCPADTRTQDNPLIIPAGGGYLVPDDFFAVQGERLWFYAVEIDRKTETIDDTPVAKTSYGRKLKTYIEAIKTRAFSRHFGIPNNVKVLTVTSNERHMHGMIRYYRSLGEPALADRFLFSHADGFGAAWRVPPLLYFTWRDANGSQVAL
jgi:hypothetical protein